MKKILVIGDVIIDEYRYGTPLGISAETPTIVSEYTHSTLTEGGAALVARHLHYLDDSDMKYRGINTKVFSIGDYTGLGTSTGLLASGLLHNILNLDGWVTPTKERIMVNGYKLAQLDTLNKGEHTPETEDKFMEVAVSLIEGVDEVIIADNRHGVINKNIATRLINHCWAAQKRVYVDSQVSQSESNHSWYYSANCFFMNLRELDAVVPNEVSFSKKLQKARDILGTKMIILKDGPKSAYVIDEYPGKLMSVSPPEVKAVDTCGAGDALMAYFVRAYDGSNAHDALREAVYYASETCTYSGAFTPEEAKE